MKKLLFLIPILATLALSQGCTTKEYYQGSQVYTRMYNVKPADWGRNQGENEQGALNYLYATVSNPDITNAVIEGGTVQAYVYIIYNVSENLGSWNPLPVVVPIEITKKDESGTVISYDVVAENTRFEFEPGSVTFVIQDLDGFDPEDIVNAMTFKVCVTI